MISFFLSYIHILRNTFEISPNQASFLANDGELKVTGISFSPNGELNENVTT